MQPNPSSETFKPCLPNARIFISPAPSILLLTDAGTGAFDSNSRVVAVRFIADLRTTMNRQI
jgi:hypothetical protein